MALAHVLGFDAQAAAEAVSGFAGVHRRFELVGEVGGVRVVDDYGHHPTEIAATLAAAAGLGFGRVRVVFQPHRYTRTELLAKEFGPAFRDADEVVVLDVFSAGETPVPGISGRTVVRSVKECDPGADIEFMPNRTEVVQHMAGTARPGDLIVTMGAGDVTVLGPSIVEALKARQNEPR
jgi:UDP-N-acetylmuramate--alanine ligase